MITDIDFARDNAGKYYVYLSYKVVKVVGYDCSGIGDCVIVSGHPRGWRRELLSPDDRILVEPDSKADGFYYVSMDDLTEIEK